MTERRVWIAQCLCGPNRHGIFALSGEVDNRREARRKLVEPLRAQLDELLAGAKINPWCGICHADKASWHIELGRTYFRTMEEAAEPLRQSEAEQFATSLLYGTHGPKNPGRPN